MPLQTCFQLWLLTCDRSRTIQQLCLGSALVIPMLHVEVWTGYFLLVDILKGKRLNHKELCCWKPSLQVLLPEIRRTTCFKSACSL